MRRRAILNSLKHGLLPWWCYEAECHYAPWSYWQHLAQNLAYAWRWLSCCETEADREFEEDINKD